MKDKFVTLVDTLIFYEGNNKHVKIPEDVKEISEFSMYQCNAETIEIPDTVTKIGDAAFARSKKLKCVNLSEGLLEIGRDAFAGCVNLEEIIIPYSVKKWGTEPLLFVKT
jgi:hypothetical protein